MTLILRKNKGIPLTTEEMDGNFEDLDARLSRIEASKEQGMLLIDQVSLDGDQLLIKTQDRQQLAPVTLPLWSAQGKWMPGKTYKPRDVVYDKNALYLCTEETTADSFERHSWICLFALEETGDKD